nr:hypothetical protein [Fodinicola feengrottensis]
MATEPAGIKTQIEDYALTAVPLAARRGGWGLLMNTAGIVSTLVQLAIGGGVTLIAGVGWGILAGLLVTVFGGTLGWLVGHVAYQNGTSSTVTSRVYGLGIRGSVIASLIYSFMIIGFLALEDALLYYGTLFMFGWKPSVVNAIVIYGLLTVVWIALTTFGLKLVQRTSTVLLIAFLILAIALAAIAVTTSGLSLSAILTAGPVTGGDGSAHFAAVIAILAGSAGGALALTDADFARYARTSKDVGILAIGGAIMIDIVMVVLGCLIVGAGSSAVATYLGKNPAVAASQQGATIAEKVSWMANNNSGAYFIVLAGLLGFFADVRGTSQSAGAEHLLRVALTVQPLRRAAASQCGPTDHGGARQCHRTADGGRRHSGPHQSVPRSPRRDHDRAGRRDHRRLLPHTAAQSGGPRRGRIRQLGWRGLGSGFGGHRRFPDRVGHHAAGLPGHPRLGARPVSGAAPLCVPCKYRERAMTGR